MLTVYELVFLHVCGDLVFHCLCFISCFNQFLLFITAFHSYIVLVPSVFAETWAPCTCYKYCAVNWLIMQLPWDWLHVQSSYHTTISSWALKLTVAVFPNAWQYMKLPDPHEALDPSYALPTAGIETSAADGALDPSCTSQAAGTQGPRSWQALGSGCTLCSLT